MSAPRPRASTEYSKGSAVSEGVSAQGRSSSGEGAGAARAAVLAAALLGALLLVVAEFTTLFEVRTATGSAVVKSVGTGSHHAYALIPIALLAAVLAYAVYAAATRPALLAIGLAGVIALLIALLGDLPDAHASGLVGTAGTHYVAASSSPTAGFYMETLGAVVLVIASVGGLLLLGPPPRLRHSRDSGGNARAAHHTGPGAAVGQPSQKEQ
jgi:hypothetical protein